MSKSIFVFGSNLAGRHGKGAALFARRYHGAIYGQGIGLQGNSYAIPTKDANLKTLSLHSIERHILDFKIFSSNHPELLFNITRVGCGLAGYTDEVIAPMFLPTQDNSILPKEWEYIKKGGKTWQS